MFDPDDLKKVNDSYGHDKSDEFVAVFGELLRRKSRNDDILSRCGGDESAVFLRRISEGAAVKRKGEEICREIGGCPTDGYRAGCSAGAVLCASGEKPSEALIEKADRALCRAKLPGKGVCCLREEPSEINP